MKAIEQTYISLLADIGYLSGIPSIRGSAYEGLSWCINDAPSLEKELLQYIEFRTPLSGAWPRWLVPLRDRFVQGEDPYDLKLLRQLLLFCYKAEHRHTDETETKTVASWRAVNSAVRTWSDVSYGDTAGLIARVRKHCTSALGFVDWREITPFHGPGAVFDGNRNKGEWSKWFSTIDSLYPYYEYFGLSRFCYRDGAEGFEIDDTIRARLVAVPKDARGPRLICVHPTEAIWIQQGLRIKMERAMARSRRQRNCPWPRGHVHFDDQTVNATLALSASSTGAYATLDLKEASDRLSDRLVQDLFGSHYRWFGCCRAQDIVIQRKLPRILEDGSLSSVNEEGQTVVPCHSYAPMGNATTFPVQSLVFWAICVSTMEAVGFHQPADCYVFGDDIIVPTEMAPHCVESLGRFGLAVNHAKSFSRGAFRESCGMDAYRGMPVTPTRWKTTYDAASLDGLQSISSIAQRLRIQGYDQAARELYSILSCRLRRMGHQLWCTCDREHGGIAEFTENAALVWRDAYWHSPKDVKVPSYQRYVSPILRLHQGQTALGHGWNHVLSSLTSLEKTGRSNDPSKSPSRRLRLNRGWADLT